ncbi:alpha/beta hydrolase [Ferruginibacter paludis]|uniref:alpha/beta hydrolase n=1 Tax=Ferruginibacter paludis TaxID=1310417 RepID=UPI0025B29D49|nr:alpha/beta fold hydrolase [Ferruginibacter paludis]MDN3658302.1 alpha/beta hydrolase [Ferruginibacter paludis]
MKLLIKILLRTLLTIFILVNIITAFHAYKFTHFYNAADVAVKQQKTGWDKTEDILFGINVAKKPDSITNTIASQTIYLYTKDSIQLEGWWIKTTDTAKGTVILFHGHGSTKAGILLESEEFGKMGYNTLLMDFRAHGNSGGNTTTIGYYEAEDVQLAYDFIKNKGEKNIVLWGISMGAAAVSKAINDYNLPANKIILEMPFGSILQAAEGRIKMMQLPPEPLATLITFWGGTEHGFWAFGMKPAEFVKKINCPVLLQWGRKDPRVTQAETDLIYANIVAPKKLVVYDNAGHESLCEKENAKWLSEVQDFLKN